MLGEEGSSVVDSKQAGVNRRCKTQKASERVSERKRREGKGERGREER